MEGILNNPVTINTASTSAPISSTPPVAPGYATSSSTTSLASPQQQINKAFAETCTSALTTEINIQTRKVKHGGSTLIETLKTTAIKKEEKVEQCLENVQKYQKWLHITHNWFGDSFSNLPTLPDYLTTYLQFKEVDSFIPHGVDTLIYSGAFIHIMEEAPSSIATISTLQKIKQTLQLPRECVACPTDILAEYLLELIPQLANPRKVCKKTAIFAPMAGSNILEMLIQRKINEMKANIDVFSYDISPKNPCVLYAPVGSTEFLSDDSFSCLYQYLYGQAINKPHQPDLYDSSAFNNIVMLLDFPQFHSKDPNFCPLHIAIDKFIRLPTPHPKTIIYWGIGHFQSKDGSIVVKNPFECAIETYNEKQKSNPLTITTVDSSHPKAFSNEVIQVVTVTSS